MKLALPYTMPTELRRLLSLIGVSGLVAMAIVSVAIFLSRMFSSASTTSYWLLPIVGLLAIVLIVALRELATLPLATIDSRRLLLTALATATLLLSLAAVSVPPTSVAVVILLAIVIVTEEVAAWWWLLRVEPVFMPPRQQDMSDASDVSRTELLLDRPHATFEDDAEEAADEEMLPDDVLQQLTRSRSESGGEIIYGLLRAEFTAGQRQEWLSVAFCPPLSVRPQCTAHFADGTSGVLEVEEVETYGVRLMIRLPRPVEAQQSLLVELFAESK